MTSEAIRALGERAVRAKGWRWMPGMLALNGQRVDRVDEYAAWDGDYTVEDAAPNVSDPATLGCVLALVREAWGDSGMFVRRSTSRGLWRVSGSDTLSRVEAPTEAEAIIAALEAAP